MDAIPDYDSAGNDDDASDDSSPQSLLPAKKKQQQKAVIDFKGKPHPLQAIRDYIFDGLLLLCQFLSANK